MLVQRCAACTERMVRQQLEERQAEEERQAVARIEAEYKPLLSEPWNATVLLMVPAVARICEGGVDEATPGEHDRL